MNTNQSLVILASISGAALWVCLVVLFVIFTQWPTSQINVPQLVNGRVLIVTIDSAATDSIYGKIWRNK
jgi:hypothetical protein